MHYLYVQYVENEKHLMSFHIRLGITLISLGLFSIHNGTNAKRQKNKKSLHNT